MKKEITVFSCGDSADICTWSNVPYLFTKTLEEKGWKLHRVDISPSKRMNRVFNTLSFTLCRRILGFGACPEFHRTWLHRFLTRRKIKRAARQWPDIDFNLFLSFAFTNTYSKKPSVLWCDWTDAVVIGRLGRKPQWYEKMSLKHETRVMKRADLVYSMFPICSRELTKMYGREVVYLGRNVVNTVYSKDVDITEIAKRKARGCKILFVGNHRYMGAARALVEIFPKVREEFGNAELHIVGMTGRQIGAEGDGIFCHGYLRKDVEQERETYYRLVLDATLFANPAANWGGYSSMVEAMYYGTPVIVSPYEDFVTDFGTEIQFGHYLRRKEDLSDNVRDILRIATSTPPHLQYINMCIAAHEAVKDYTWERYVDVFIDSLRKKSII